MNYRPEGWKGYIERLADDNGIDVRTQSIIMPMDDYSAEAFEAGADAMLEGLKKEPYARIKNDYDPIYTFGIDETDYLPKGYLVFIPEEE